nr:toxin HicA [Leifsonia naganoensis]
MTGVEKILVEMRSNPKGVSFVDLVKVCEEFFGPPRQKGSSHMVFRMPRPGDPRVNIQNGRGAKPHQVRQVLTAIDRLKGQGR